MANCTIIGSSTTVQIITVSGAFLGRAREGSAYLTNCYIYGCVLGTGEDTKATNNVGLFTTYQGDVAATNCYYYDENGVTVNCDAAVSQTKEMLDEGTAAELLGDAFANGTDYPVFVSTAPSARPLLKSVFSTGTAEVDEGLYDLTWNISVSNSMPEDVAQDFVAFNAQYTILDTGVIITVIAADAETAKSLALSEDTSISGKAYKESFNTTVYTYYSYRRTSVAAGRG